jgi:hypothetical protein
MTLRTALLRCCALTKVLGKLDVANRETGEVLGTFNQMKADVVGH